MLRIIIETDDDKQDYLFGEPIRPYRLALEKTDETLEDYIVSDSSYVTYDPFLGWTHRPNGVSADGVHHVNADGIRANVEYELAPPPGTVRIALFGDSYTHATDSALEDSWGYQLEHLLEGAGYDVEVLNFGVGGYGMDQAYLRWQNQGAAYSPDIVIFGFVAADAPRNVNLFRSIYKANTGVPFSKPRYILDDGQLRLVNSPTVPLDQVHNTLASFDDSPLSAFEYYYDESFQRHWWQNSKLVAVVHHLTAPDLGRKPAVRRKSSDSYQLDGDIAAVSLAIIDAFYEEVQSNDAEFVIVHLPSSRELVDLDETGGFIYSDMLAYLDARYQVVHPEEFVVLPDDISDFAGHYTPRGQSIVAGAVYDTVVSLIANVHTLEG